MTGRARSDFFPKKEHEVTLVCGRRSFVAVIHTYESGIFVHRVYQVVEHPRRTQGVRRKVYPAHPINASVQSALDALGADAMGRIAND